MRLPGGGAAGEWEGGEGTAGVLVTGRHRQYGRSLSGTGDADGSFAGTDGAGAHYSHSPSRAVAVRPGAAAYRTARLPGFCPASWARRMMSNTAAPPRLPLV